MSIRVGGTIVIDDSRNFSNVTTISASTYTGDGGNLTNISKVEYIKRPIPFSPITGDTGMGLTANLIAAPYRVTYQDDTRAYREFQLTTNADTTFSSIQRTANVNADFYAIPEGSELDVNTTYRWRCRDFSSVRAANVLYQTGASANASAFSDVQTFTTTNVVLGTPSITSPTENQVTTNTGFTATSNAFSVVTGSDTHLSSDWQVSALSNFSNTIVSSTGNTSAKTSFTFAGTSFVVGVTYYMRTRHRGVSGVTSAYSATRTFTRASSPGQIVYSSAGTYTFTAPAGITSISVVGVGGGGGGTSPGGNGQGGGGGGLAYRNSISVTPGSPYTVTVGKARFAGSWSTTQPNGTSGGTSTFFDVSAGAGQQSGSSGSGGGISGPYAGGGNGGPAGTGGTGQSGGGGAGGYSGNGGTGGDRGGGAGSSGSGGAGGGGGGGPAWGTAGSGGGVGLLGSGPNGGGGGENTGGTGGSGGSGSLYGGGGGGGGGGSPSGPVGVGGIRIMWPGDVRTYPSTRVADE
jgi:hypothetical protein